MGRKIAVAMSGGVDSSVVAYLMSKKYGQENVFGVTLKLFETDGDYLKRANKVCEQLGIKHYVVDIREAFKTEIIDYFISEYKAGKTPNPCVKCNRVIKFGELFREAVKMGATYVATGHYVISKLKGGSSHLYKGKDKIKDQSYFLYRLTQYELSHALFPLGKMTKNKVRKIAKKLGLFHLESESQEVCFIQTTTNEFLRDRIKEKAGDIVDINGKKVGRHKGAHLFTIGQRKGIGVAHIEPYYVVDVDIKKNKVVVGREDDLYKNRLEASDTNWIAGKTPPDGARVDVKIRYSGDVIKSQLFTTKDKLKIEFLGKARAVTPGQSVVIYRGKELLGGGIIDR